MSENKIHQSDEADDEIYYKSPLKSKSRWGWGWFILLLSYSSWYNKAAVKPNTIIGILVPVVMFVFYFWLRTRMIGMFSKLWKVSFVAGIVSLFLSGFLIAFIGSMFTVDSLSHAQVMAQELNKTLPKLVDSETRLDSVSAGPDKRITYNMTMINYSAKELASLKFIEGIREEKRVESCASDAIKFFFKEGLSIRFRYRGNDGKLITDLDIVKSDCDYSK